MSAHVLQRHQAILSEVASGARPNLLHALRVLEVAQRPLTPRELTDAMFVDLSSWRFVSQQAQDEILQLLQSKRIMDTMIVPSPSSELESAYWDEERNDYCIQAIGLSPRFRAGQGQADTPKSAAWMAQSHAIMATICLIYLMNCDTPSMHGAAGSHAQALAAYGAEYRMLQWRQDHLFGTYAARYWSIHSYFGRLRGGPEDEDLVKAQLALLGSPEYTESWLQIHDAAEEEIQASFAPKRYGWAASRDPLFHAAFHGLETALQRLLQRALAYHETDTSQSLDETLQAAAFTARSSLVELLLSYGASPNAHVGPFESALVAAAAGGDAGILSALFRAGAVMPNQVDHQHPFLVAATCGNTGAMAFLSGSLGAIKQQVLDYTLSEILGHLGHGGQRDDVIRTLTELGAQQLDDAG